MVNDKAAASVHPGNPNGYTVQCIECHDADLFRALFRDVADWFATEHAALNDHTTTVVERPR
jgi:hypothetical protein